MSVLDRLFGVEERSVTWDSFSGDVAEVWANQSMTTSGERVTEDTSLQVSAVFGSVRVITEPICTLPVTAVLPEKNGTSAPYPRRPTWLDVPNPLRPELTWIALVQQALWSLLLWGDAFIATYRDDRGAVVALDLLDPDSVFIDMNTDTHDRIYWVGPQADRLPLPGAAPYTSYDITHIPGYMLPGAWRGLSVIRRAMAETIGLAKAAQTFGAAFFGNGAHPGLVIEVPGELNPTQQTMLKQAWNDVRQGANNAHRIAVATQGASFKQVSIRPDEAQFIETRQFSVPDIARFFGVPPHLIADASNSTSWGSGLAEQNAGFAQNVLTPWVARLEEGLTRLLRSDLLINRAAKVKFNMAAFARGTLKERVEVYGMGLEMGLWCIDECRAWEDMAPLPDGLGQVHRGKNAIIPLAVGDAYPTPTKDANLPKGNPELPANETLAGPGAPGEPDPTENTT